MVKVDQEKCIGCQTCVSTCPAVFKMNEQGKSEVLSQEDVACSQRAADDCPVKAITVEG